jgi:hypothetical protein
MRCCPVPLLLRVDSHPPPYRQEQERTDKQQAQAACHSLKLHNDGLTGDMSLRDQIIASLKDEVRAGAGVGG